MFVRSSRSFHGFYWLHIDDVGSLWHVPRVAGSLFITLLARRGKLGFRVTATPGPRWWNHDGMGEIWKRQFLVKEGLSMICLPFFFCVFWIDACCVHSPVFFSQTPYIPRWIQAQNGRGLHRFFILLWDGKHQSYWIGMARKSLGFLEDCNTQQTPIVAYVFK